MTRTNKPTRVVAFVAMATAALAGFTSCADTGSSTADNGSVSGLTPSQSSSPASTSKSAPEHSLPPFPAPAEFVSAIDNPYFPLEPGTRWVYEGKSSEGGEKIVVTVTDKPKMVAGVPATVVRDL